MLQVDCEQKGKCSPDACDGGDDCGCDDGNSNDDCGCGCDKKKKNYCSINPCDKAVDLLYGIDKNVEVLKCDVKHIKSEQKVQGNNLTQILDIVS